MTRHFFSSPRGILSNEDDTPPEVDASDAGTAEALASLAAEGEAVEAEADAAADSATVSNGTDGIIALEEMRVTLRAANENGGLDRFGAMMAKQHADFILKKFLKSPDGLTMPATESFGGSGNRVDAGILTMESIKDSAKKIWDGIVKFLKKIKDKVMAWINKIFGAAEKLGQRADSIKKRADGVSGTPKEKTFDDDTLFNALAIASAVEGAKLKTAMGSIVKLSEAMIKESTDGNEEVNKTLDIMDGITVDNAKAELAKIATMTAAAVPPTPVMTTGTELPGNVTLRNPAPVDAGTPAERIEGYGLPTNGAKAKAGVKLPTLDVDTVKSLCTMVKSISDTLVATRKVGPASEKAYKRLEEFAKKQMSESDLADSTDAADKSAHADIVKAFKQVSGTVDGPIKSLAGYILKTSRSTLDYCDASLGQY